MADRAVRRLLPVAALFRLSLVFPDRAPSRFKAAIRSGTVRQLQRQMASGDHGRATPQEAAEQLIGLASSLNGHDRMTRGHTERVRAYSAMIGEEMGLGSRDLELLNWSGLVHDIGKGGRFSYYKCPGGDGRLTPFSEFLKEKQFVRALNPAEKNRLRAEIKQVQCSSCGAPVDVERGFECGHCGSAITVLDADAVAKTLHELETADAAVRDVDPDEREVAWTQLLTALGAPPAHEPPEAPPRAG